jgi:hypothetical protein
VSPHWYIKVLKVLASALVILTLTTGFLAWLAHRPPGQEATGQELTVQEVTAPADSLPLTVVAPELTQEAPLEPKPEGIPGLSVMDVIGNLKHFPTEGRFVCDGPQPTDGRESEWVCWAPVGESPSTYEVSVVGENPLTVFSVDATVRGLSDEQAAEFFSYVASLCLQESDPLNPQAWVEQNIASGGQVFTEGAELTIYGTKQERTLQVVATDFTVD